MKEDVEEHMTGVPSYVGLLGVFCVTYMLGKKKIGHQAWLPRLPVLTCQG
jgi:hypothetical protein